MNSDHFRVHLELDLYMLLSVFSPLHTCVQGGRLGSDDLPDLNLPDFSKSVRVRGKSRTDKDKRKGQFMSFIIELTVQK